MEFYDRPLKKVVTAKQKWKYKRLYKVLGHDKEAEKLYRKLQKGDSIQRGKKFIIDNILPMIYRKDWNAIYVPPQHETLLWNPIKNVVFTYTEGEECHTKEECLKRMQEMQKVDIYKRALSDIQYHYYIGSDGNMYEGRGWIIDSEKDIGYEHLAGVSLDIAYIGDWEDREPTDVMKAAARWLVSDLIINCIVEDKFGLVNLGERFPIDGTQWIPEIPDDREYKTKWII